MFISIGLFIPLQVSLIPLSVLIKNMGLANTHWALILPYIAFNLAFPFMIISSSFRALPAELEEAAVIDGASIYKTFFSIMLPLVKPAMGAAMMIASIPTIILYLCFSDKIENSLTVGGAVKG